MLEILLCTLVAFAISAVLTPEIIKIAHFHEIHDHVDARKSHTHKVPRFGGVAIFFGFLIASLLVSTVFGLMINQYLIIALLMVVTVGFRDDFLPLRPRIKLAVEVLASLIIIYFGQIRIESLHGVFGVDALPIWVSYVLTIFTLIVVTNAVNLIDGIDGLAGTFSVLVFGGYGTWFCLTDDLATSLFCFGVVGAILGFLLFNYRTLIFMGDTGSLMLGFLAATMTILFLQDNAALATDHPLQMASPVFVACAMLAFPLVDTLRVFVMRVARGTSPFSPDKNHLHHLLIALGLPHYQATLILCGASASFVGLAMLCQGMDDALGIGLGAALALLLAHYLKKRVDARRAKQAKASETPKPNLTNA
jgi:UDP-GlcNAc:undecaprenyl-phosphate/decaprenyl-phosphate GlcNAc-1-phosphate transferase